MSRRPLPDGFTELGPNRDTRVLPFFLLVFVSWVVWIPAGARMAGVLPFPFPSEIAWAGVFTPFILSLIFIYKAGGMRGLMMHLGRFIKWRFPLKYWFFAVLAMPLIGLSVVVLWSIFADPILAQGFERLLDGTVQDKVLARMKVTAYESAGFQTALNDYLASSLGAFLIGYLLVGLTDGGISEEPGWRGFAYPILQDRWGALPAALMVGLVWAAWHLGPLQWQILFADGPEAFLNFLPGHAMMYLIGVAPLAIIFAWLYEATRGSLLVCFIVHDSFNNTSLMASYMFPEAPVMYGIIAFLWATVIWILIKNGWRSFGPKEG